MPVTKEKLPKISQEVKNQELDPEDSFPIFDEDFFAKIAEDPFFKEKRERVTKILEKVDWSEPLDKPKQ